jgi:hypothetical protein
MRFAFQLETISDEREHGRSQAKPGEVALARSSAIALPESERPA